MTPTSVTLASLNVEASDEAMLVTWETASELDNIGKDLAEKLLALRPEIKVLFMSGYTADIITNQGLIPGGTNFLEKPISLETLAATVREVLDTAP